MSTKEHEFVSVDDSEPSGGGYVALDHTFTWNEEHRLTGQRIVCETHRKVLMENVLKKIRYVWGRDSRIEAFLWDLLEFLKGKSIDYIALGSIQIPGYAPGEVFQWVNWFSSGIVPLFIRKYEFEDDFDFPEVSISSALETGQLFHPVTGHEIKDFKDRIFVYYEGQELLRKMLGR